jgi:hypothetical protein
MKEVSLLLDQCFASSLLSHSATIIKNNNGICKNNVVNCDNKCLPKLSILLLKPVVMIVLNKLDKYEQTSNY